jgi:hypothetical protein
MFAIAGKTCVTDVRTSATGARTAGTRCTRAAFVISARMSATVVKMFVIGGRTVAIARKTFATGAKIGAIVERTFATGGWDREGDRTLSEDVSYLQSRDARGLRPASGPPL